MAWFAFTDASEEIFVARIDDPDVIAHARELLAGTETADPLIGGIIITQPAAYNIGWSYHLDPESIFFFEFSIEVGDATMRYIEEHVDEVGGTFLPGSRWTPWTSVLLEELQARSGGADQDLLVGTIKADLLFGKAGDDCLLGAAGNDHLVGGSGRDKAFGGRGDDKLGGGAGNDSLWGGAGGDVLDGDGGHDRLCGGAGNDALLGGKGEDALHGGAGADRLAGDSGSDQLVGGAGADHFDYDAITDSGPAAAKRDRIVDFTQGLDHIDLSTIDTDHALDDDQAFTFISSNAFSAPGQVRFSSLGGITTVFVNTDRDAEFEMAIDLLGSMTLTLDDFVL